MGSKPWGVNVGGKMTGGRRRIAVREGKREGKELLGRRTVMGWGGGIREKGVVSCVKCCWKANKKPMESVNHSLDQLTQKMRASYVVTKQCDCNNVHKNLFESVDIRNIQT